MNHTTSTIHVPVFLTALLMVGCLASEEGRPIPSARVVNTSPEAPTKKRVESSKKADIVLWVNEEGIERKDIDTRLQRVIRFKKSQHESLSAHQLLLERKRIEDLFIGQRLLLQHAKEKNITLEKDEAEKELARYVEKNFGSLEAFQAHLDYRSVRREDFLQDLKNSIIVKRLFPEIKTTKEELLDRFFQDFQEHGIREKSRITLFHSSIKRTHAPMKYLDFRNALKRKMLGDIIAKHNLGWISPEDGDLPPEVFTTPAHQVIGIANEEGTFFYWIMKKRKILNPKFLMMKHRLKLSLIRDKREEKRLALIEELRGHAKIRYQPQKR